MTGKGDSIREITDVVKSLNVRPNFFRLVLPDCSTGERMWDRLEYEKEAYAGKLTSHTRLGWINTFSPKG